MNAKKVLSYFGLGTCFVSFIGLCFLSYAFVSAPVKAEDPPPPPDFVIPFKLVSGTNVYRADMVFVSSVTTGWVPSSQVTWEETDDLGQKTGRIFVSVPEGVEKWDVMPPQSDGSPNARDGSFNMYNVLEILNQKNPGKGFDSASVSAFILEHPTFSFDKVLLTYGRDINGNKQLDSEEVGTEFYIHEQSRDQTCQSYKLGKSWATIVFVTLNYSGGFDPALTPSELNYPIWFTK